jgi:hypothetical protein
MLRRHYALLGFIAMFAVTMGSGVYAKYLTLNESKSISIAVPAGNVTQPTTISGSGRSVSMAPVSVDLDKRGLPKQLVHPNLENIGSKSIINLGKNPVTIRLELMNCSLPVKWLVTSAWPYDPATHTFTKPLPPGGSITGLSMNLWFTFPTDDPSYIHNTDGVIVYNGGLRVTDANSGELLTFIPITIGRGTTSVGGDNCCSPS